MIDDEALLDAGAKRIERIGNHVLIQGDCMDIMPALGKVDAVITDPPYGIGIAEYDVVIDIPKFTHKIYELLPADAWFVWFGQMPTMINFIESSIGAGFKWVDHISWVKRAVTAIACPLNRTHESIFSYKKGRPKHYCKKGPYSDVKPDLLHTMPEFIEGVKRRLQGDIRKKKSAQSNEVYSYMHIAAELGPNSPTNFTNVWSFLPEAHSNCMGARSGAEKRVNHPTIKPTKLMNRLLKVYSDDNQTILDPFMGSGTTGVACEQLDRHFIGIELDPDYFQIACDRIRKAHMQPKLFGEAATKQPQDETADMFRSAL